MIDTSKQLLNPNDDSYIDTGIKEGTFEVTGMSGDTSPEFRAQLDKEREAQKDQELAEYYEAMYPEEFKPQEPEATPEDIFHMADELRSLKEQKAEVESTAKALGKLIEELDRKLSDAMVESDLVKFTRNGKTFHLTTRLFASPRDGNSDLMIQTLKDNGYGDLVKETVNSNTLSSFAKEQKEANNDEMPEWLDQVVNTYEKVSVGIRKN